MLKMKRGVSNRQVAVTVVILIIIAAVLVVALYYMSSGSSITTTTTSTSTVTGCPPNCTTSTPIPASQKPIEVVVQRNAPTNDMDPRSTSSIDVVQNVYETLTYILPNGTIVPGLAVSWTHNANFTNWQYTLRQGVTFHDGTPFNSTAVVFSVKNIVKWGGGDAPDVWATLKDVFVTGPYTVNFTTTEPTNMPFVTSSAYSAFIFSPNILKYSRVTNDTLALHNWFTSFHDDGTGPYMINSSASSLTANQIELDAYPNYWGGWRSNQITKIVFKFVSVVSTAVNLAISGQLHVIGISGQYQYVPSLLQAGLQVKTGPSFAAIWLLFNTRHPYLNNSLVRRALLTAVDYNDIVNKAYYGYGQPFGGIINPGKPFYDPNAPRYGPPANLTFAKYLLAKAGYPGGLNVTWTITYSTGSPFLNTVAQELQTFWKPLGVTLNIQGMSFGQLAKKAGYFDPKTGTVFKPGPISYANSSNAQDILLLNWVGATADPWLVPNELFAIQTINGQQVIIYNWSYWTNSTFTDLLNKARIDEVLNPSLAQQEFRQLNTMFYQAAPGTGLFAENQVWILSPHLQGYVPNPYYGFDYIFYYQLTYNP
jgi:peptide/nickel transport system substrate-binding protein